MSKPTANTLNLCPALTARRGGAGNATASQPVTRAANERSGALGSRDLRSCLLDTSAVETSEDDMNEQWTDEFGQIRWAEVAETPESTEPADSHYAFDERHDHVVEKPSREGAVE